MVTGKGEREKRGGWNRMEGRRGGQKRGGKGAVLPYVLQGYNPNYLTSSTKVSTSYSNATRWHYSTYGQYIRYMASRGTFKMPSHLGIWSSYPSVGKKKCEGKAKERNVLFLIG
jgi:hypothetical protein